MKISVGIEGTFAPQCGKDTLAITGHYKIKQWREDLRIIRELGIEEFRYPIPWHRIERNPGEYDWSHLDEFIPHATSELGLSLIADPLHHTSYPEWFRAGFGDESFANHYIKFVTEFGRRYPEVTRYTPFNEPSCTLDFCGYRGFWFPYQKGDWSYIRMLRNTARATAGAIHKLRQQNRNVHVLHVDTFEHHSALDENSRARTDFLNERRFLFEELVGGKVTENHPLHSYLKTNGFSERDLAWHEANPARIDERGR